MWVPRWLTDHWWNAGSARRRDAAKQLPTGVAPGPSSKEGKHALGTKFAPLFPAHGASYDQWRMHGTIALSGEALDEFKQIYQSEFGEALTDAQAQELGLRLLRIFDLLSRPLPEDKTNGCEPIDS